MAGPRAGGRTGERGNRAGERHVYQDKLRALDQVVRRLQHPDTGGSWISPEFAADYADGTRSPRAERAWWARVTSTA